MDAMRPRLLPLLAAAALVAGAGSAVAASPTGTKTGTKTATTTTAATPQSAVTTVRLHVRIATSSDWTKVLLSPGLVEATKVTSITPMAQLITGSRGWELRPLVGDGVLELDAVFDDANKAASYGLEIQKGANGATTVTVQNTTGAAYTAATATNTRSSATDPTNSRTTSVSRNALFGSTSLSVPRADDRRLVLAFYYPWFGGYGDPGLGDRPLRPRSTTDPVGVRSMTDQARAAGIDGFIVSWSGNARDGAEYDLALGAAAATAGVVAPYLETTEASKEARSTGRTTAQVVQSWLGEVTDRSANPAMLKAGGETVVFVWDTDLLTPQEWASILATARLTGRPLKLVTDDTAAAYEGVSWGTHRYTVNESLAALTASHRHETLHNHAPAVLDPGTTPRLYAATVSPGFDDTVLRGTTNRIVPRGLQGERYAGSWTAATSARPDWVLINSWNEWYEGTTIEPSLKYGDLALRQTKDRAAAWHTAR